MLILKYKRIFLTISIMISVFLVGAIGFFGFNLSVDFAGGTIYEVKYEEKIPLLENVNKAVSKSGLGISVVQKVGEDSFAIKTPELTTELKRNLKKELTFDEQYKFSEVQSKTIGPAVSSELAKRSFFAILFVTFMIVLFIAFTFKGVSKPVSSFKYGLVAIVALAHDILIPIGIFAIIGSFFLHYQIDVLFVTALLAILGFSVNDTIVVFDRIRENLKKAEEKNESVKGDNFEKIVGASVSQTITRSINTSVTTLIVLLFLFFMGGDTTKAFSLVLILGVIAGTYSSIFIASPLLVYIERFQKEKKEGDNDEYKEDGIDPSKITI